MLARRTMELSRRIRKLNYWQDAPVPRGQLVLIPTALEEVIPSDHPVRLVDEILELLDWTPWEAAYHGSHGQPPIHPSVLAKTLLFAMIRRIRSSRQMEYELKHSIDFMWLTSGRRIDHTTLSEFRRKHSKELRGIFKQMIKLAIDLKIANLAELCIDGTRVLANANRYKTWTSDRLAKALEQLDSQIAEALATLEANDSLDEDLLGDDISAEHLPEGVADLQSRREQLAAHMETAKAMDELRTTENTTYRGGKPVQRKVYTCRDCAGCELAGRCRKNPDAKRGREVMHDEHEGARRRHRERMKTEEAQVAYSRRQHFGETPFAVIKTCLDLRRFLLRGIEGVGQEWQWAATAFNLKKLMSRWGKLRHELSQLNVYPIS